MEAEQTTEHKPTYEVEEVVLKKDYGTDLNYKHKYVWQLVLAHVLLQIGWVIGIYCAIFHCKGYTLLWSFLIALAVGQAVSLGAHRYYSHRSFKPTLPVKFTLLLFHAMAGQNSMLRWATDHKLHHKFSDTDADPHNSSRGFFFSHMGWLMVKRHPLLQKKRRELDISDLRQDKLLMFQYKYFTYIYIIAGMIFPVAVPMYFWNESFVQSFFVAYCLQYVSSLHSTWFINSAAHLWGSRPYDKRVQAVESTFTWIVTGGEGWHNYHHAFPWDYRLSEYGTFGGVATNLINFLNYVGLVHDLKVASPRVVYGHMKRHGDDKHAEIFTKKFDGLLREELTNGGMRAK